MRTGRPPWWYVLLAVVGVPLLCSAALWVAPLGAARVGWLGPLLSLLGLAAVAGSVVALIRLGRSRGVSGGWIAAAIAAAAMVTVVASVAAFLALWIAACSPDGC